ncbi:MAG: exopolysaccharide biosynthesis polyprenyl glycosylphosphotransferase, partial [Candidatus Marinimicrobia bacterium]|nr:exopolysaccharide biosynthesis polyprenyl glycosylphosphotransferase [Candidatus Neomarinimicrobiota bacterium]
HNLAWHLRRLWLAQGLFVSAVFVYLVASKSQFISRQFLLIFFPLEIILLTGWHVCRRQIMVWYRSKGKNYKSAIVVGDMDRVSEFSAWAHENPEYGYRVDKNICYDDSKKNYANILKQELKKSQYDELVILTGGSFGVLIENQIQEIINEAENWGLRVMIAPSYMRNYSQRIEIDNLNGQTVLSIRYEPLQYLHNRLLKRLFDFLLSTLIFLLIYWWFHIIVGILIKLSSKGPVLFKQKRIGINDKPFICYKFRTMRQTEEKERDAENGIGEITSENDQRITWIGKLLRKSNLDELPQFLNVLKGDMSVVGPRPHMLQEDLEIRKIVPRYRIRQFVKPGITGWAAVNGYRGGTKDLNLMKKRTEHDIWYIENWSLSLDVKIVLRTIWQMITFRIPNAY